MNWVWPKAPAQEPVRRVRPDVAAVDDLQRREELAAEIALAAVRHAGQASRATAPAGAPPMSLPKFDSTPQTPAMMWRSTPKRLSACASACAVLAHGGAAVLDPLLVDEEAEIVPDRRLELGLVVHQLEDLHVGLHAARRRRRRSRPGTPLATAWPRRPARQARKSDCAAAGATAIESPRRARAIRRVMASI